MSGFWGALLSEGDRRLEELASQASKIPVDASLTLLHSELQALLNSNGNVSTTATAEAGADGAVSVHAVSAQLMQLCSNTNLSDEATFNSIPDPALVHLKELVASHQHEAAVEAYLQMDMPSVRWDTALTAPHIRHGPTHTLTDSGTDSGAAIRGNSNQSLEVRSQLLSWACKRLSDLNRDASAAYIHQQFIKAALRDRGLLRFKPEWWRLSLPHEELPRGIKLSAAVYHLSSSRDAAWTALERCLWHNMALSPRLDAAFQVGSQDRWSPFAFESAKVDLEQAHMEMVQRAMKHAASMAQSEGAAEAEAGPPPAPGAPPSNKITKLQEELLAMLGALTPVTYLQMVGQKLLYHAAVQLPMLASLPDAIQPSVVRALYTLPFSKAVSMALEVVCDDPEGLDPTPFAPKAADEVVKKWRVLQSNAVSAPGEGRTEQGTEGKGPSKSGIKIVLHVIKGITKDIADFEQGLALILDQVPEVLREATGSHHLHQGFVQDIMAAWSLRGHALRAQLRSELESALLVHRSGVGTLLVTAMTRSVRAMLTSPAKGPSHGDSAPMAAEDVNSDLWPQLEEVPEVSGAMLAHSPDDDAFNNEKPKYIDPISHQVLNFLSGTIHRMPNYPDLVQALLSIAVLECFSLLMDHLASSCTPAHGIGQALSVSPQHAPRMLLLHHGAAACARRQLLAFHFALRLPLFDEYYEGMVKGYANALLQAEELVSALGQHIVRIHASAANAIVLPAVDSVPWSGVRRPLKRARAASAAPRAWRCCLTRLLHALVQLSSPAFSGWVMGQVLQEGLASAALRYSQLVPSPQLLPHYVADVLHLTCTVYMFTLQRALPSAAELMASKGPSRSVSRLDRVEPREPSGLVTFDGRPSIEVSMAVAKATSDMCHALCTRAALLICAPAELEAALASDPFLPGRAGGHARPQLPSALPSMQALGGSPAASSLPPAAAVKPKLPAIPGRISQGGSLFDQPILPASPGRPPPQAKASSSTLNEADSSTRELTASTRASPREPPSAGGGPVGESTEEGEEPPQGQQPQQQPQQQQQQQQQPLAPPQQQPPPPGAPGGTAARLPTHQGPSSSRGLGRSPLGSVSQQPSGISQTPSGILSHQRSRPLALEGEPSDASSHTFSRPGPSAMANGPWSWLPDAVRAALRREAMDLVREEELVHGFNPVNHMDVSIEAPFNLVLAVDKAEVAAAAKAMAAIGRERTLRREETRRSSVASGAADGPSTSGPSVTAAGSTHSLAAVESPVAAAWNELMTMLAATAPSSAARSALPLRHELQPEVPGLPYSDLEKQERAHVQRLAQAHHS